MQGNGPMSAFEPARIACRPDFFTRSRVDEADLQGARALPLGLLVLRLEIGPIAQRA
jgi:hypothetical protein